MTLVLASTIASFPGNPKETQNSTLHNSKEQNPDTASKTGPDAQIRLFVELQRRHLHVARPPPGFSDVLTPFHVVPAPAVTSPANSWFPSRAFRYGLSAPDVCFADHFSCFARHRKYCGPQGGNRTGQCCNDKRSCAYTASTRSNFQVGIYSTQSSIAQHNHCESNARQSHQANSAKGSVAFGPRRANSTPTA